MNTSSLRLLTACLGALMFACSDDPEPTPADTPDASSPTPTPDAGTAPVAPADAITLATITACPQSADILSTTEWTACLVGKRAIGKDALTGVPCELRFKTDGAFEYVKNGVVMATPPLAQWDSPTGQYTNQINQGNRQYIGSLSSRLSVDKNYGIELHVKSSTTVPNEPGLNEDTAKYTLADGINEETCKLDYL